MNDFKYTQPKNIPVTSEELLSDLKDVAKKLKTDTLTQKLYSENGKYDVTTLSCRFGTWNKALNIVGLKPGNINNYSDEQLFENILTIWQYKGSQPTRRDLALPPSKISQSPYNRRFNSWSHALKSFVEYTNQNEMENNNIKQHPDSTKIIKNTSRDPSLRLRFQVLKRDNFSCRQCGASPANDKSVELHVDHITPWSKGGETVINNLQTLCSKCNLGKSNLD